MDECDFFEDCQTYDLDDMDADDDGNLLKWLGNTRPGDAGDELLHGQLPHTQAAGINIDGFDKLFYSFDRDSLDHCIDGEISQFTHDDLSSLLQADKYLEDSSLDFKSLPDTSYGSYDPKYPHSLNKLNCKSAINAPLLLKQKSKKEVNCMFETSYHEVDDSASGISGFYMPGKYEVKAAVFSAIVDDIKATDKARKCKEKKNIQGPICGIGMLQDKCKECNGTKEGNMVLYAGCITHRDRKNKDASIFINKSITDIFHSVWFFPKAGKDIRETKKYIKKLKQKAMDNIGERKVVILEEDFQNYCNGKYKLPEHIMNTPVLVLKQKAFDKARSRYEGKSKKRKAQMSGQCCKRAKYEVPKTEV